jgi:hypothetical protein
MIPEFAILGHPNEGKSSVLSTLAEDDSVRVSSTPGETIKCRTFPVTIDGREILRFVDTPGFQNPRRVLTELLNGSDDTFDFFRHFIETNKDQPAFSDDCELLRPIVEGAGIIYVVDASRPLRNIDKAEMEILRLTGKPRMAIMNCKENESTYLKEWKNELRKSFNSTRMFNAHRATYAERIRLLESLKSIDQDWQRTLEKVVDTFKQDWESRNNRTIDILCTMLNECLTYKVTSPFLSSRDLEKEKKKLHTKYTKNIKEIEKKSHEQIRALFKHNIFNYTLPPYSILHEDLFNEKTWQFLGLDKKQMAIVGGLGGAALAAGLDLAVGGASLGLFTTLGGALGAAGALYGGKSLSSKTKLLGLGDEKIQVGPNENIQFLFILIDRTLVYYSHIINWAHGRRDYEKYNEDFNTLIATEYEGFSKNFSLGSLKICHSYFKAISGGNENTIRSADKELKEVLRTTLLEISYRE